MSYNYTDNVLNSARPITSKKFTESLAIVHYVYIDTNLLSDIEISGVDRFNESSLVIKARIKTQAMEHSNIRREYLRLMKQAFQKAKIKPPYSQVIIHRSR